MCIKENETLSVFMIIRHVNRNVNYSFFYIISDVLMDCGGIRGCLSFSYNF